MAAAAWPRLIRGSKTDRPVDVRLTGGEPVARSQQCGHRVAVDVTDLDTLGQTKQRDIKSTTDGISGC